MCENKTGMELVSGLRFPGKVSSLPTVDECIKVIKDLKFDYSISYGLHRTEDQMVVARSDYGQSLELIAFKTGERAKDWGHPYAFASCGIDYDYALTGPYIFGHIQRRIPQSPIEVLDTEGGGIQVSNAIITCDLTRGCNGRPGPSDLHRVAHLLGPYFAQNTLVVVNSKIRGISGGTLRSILKRGI